MADHGAESCANGSEPGRRGATAFEKFLVERETRHILSGVGRPQASGKTGRPFGEARAGPGTFADAGEIVAWRDAAKPHRSPNFEAGETPCGALGARMPPEGAGTVAGGATGEAYGARRGPPRPPEGGSWRPAGPPRAGAETVSGTHKRPPPRARYYYLPGARRPVKQGSNSGSAVPSPGGDALGCLVGDIVITSQEIESRVKKCTEGRQEWLDKAYPKTRPRMEGHGARGAGARYEKTIYPDPHDPSDARFRSRDKLKSMWREMGRAIPVTITDGDLAIRVNTSCKYRNGVAHARRACGGAAIRNDRWRETYGEERLVEYLGYMRDTLAYVEQLYAHLGRVPLE